MREHMIAAPYENIQFIQVSTMKKKKKSFQTLQRNRST